MEGGLIDRLGATARRYPRPLWLLAISNFVLFTARGMTMPFLVIFFGQVLGLGEGLVGAGIAANAAVGIAFTFLAAGLIDRAGPRATLIATIAGIAAMTACFPLATTPLLFFGVMVLHGCASQLYWPAGDALATSLVPVEQAGEMFAMLRVASALGIGAGGLVGGLMVADGTLPEYRALYLTSALGSLLGGALILALVRPPLRPAREQRRGEQAGSWREVFADRRFVYSQVVMFVLLSAFTQLQVSAPPYLKREAGIGEASIGLLFSINTVIVVAAQIPVARWIAGWGRGATFALAAACWSVAFALIGASPWLPLLPFAAIVVYTLGEMLFMPTSGVVVVELAPERLRGRYLALSSVVWGGAWGLASWASGTVLGSSHPTLLWPGLIGVLVAGALGALRYDRLAGASRRPPAPAPVEAD